MKLNSIQKKLLQKHWNNYKYCYNKTISILNGNEYTSEIPDCIRHLIPENEKIQRASIFPGYSKFEIRDMICPKECNSRTEWLLETGFSIRTQAVFQAYSAWKTCLSNLKAGNIKYFDLKYKKKKNIKWTMNIDRTNLTRYKSGISLYSESGIMRTNEDFEINNDCKIHFDGKYYYILVPREIEIKYNKTQNDLTCALDPGKRKFHTMYSEEDETIFIGIHASNKIQELMLKLDKAKHQKTELKLRRKIKNLQTEMHNKTSRFLCENYNNIVISRLSKNNDIFRKKNRKLSKKSVRQMAVLGHSIFLEKLKAKAEEYHNVQVNEITEEYTSQVCPKCNKCTKTDNEQFICKHCNFCIDRDILGSRNIFLKYYNLLKIPKFRLDTTGTCNV